MEPRPVQPERHGMMLHHALVAGLLAVTTLALIGTVGAKVLGRWTSDNAPAPRVAAEQ